MWLWEKVDDLSSIFINSVYRRPRRTTNIYISILHNSTCLADFLAGSAYRTNKSANDDDNVSAPPLFSVCNWSSPGDLSAAASGLQAHTTYTPSVAANKNGSAAGPVCGSGPEALSLQVTNVCVRHSGMVSSSARSLGLRVLQWSLKNWKYLVTYIFKCLLFIYLYEQNFWHCKIKTKKLDIDIHKGSACLPKPSDFQSFCSSNSPNCKCYTGSPLSAGDTF